MAREKATMAIQVLPNVGSEAEVVRVVDCVIDYIASTGLEYQVGALETSIEGDFETLCEIAKRSQEICIEEGAASVSTYIKFIYSPQNGVLSIEDKTAKHQR